MPSDNHFDGDREVRKEFLAKVFANCASTNRTPGRIFVQLSGDLAADEEVGQQRAKVCNFLDMPHAACSMQSLEQHNYLTNAHQVEVTASPELSEVKWHQLRDFH